MTVVEEIKAELERAERARKPDCMAQISPRVLALLIEHFNDEH